MYLAFSIVIFVLLLVTAILLFRMEERGYAIAAVIFAIIWGLTHFIGISEEIPSTSESAPASAPTSYQTPGTIRVS